MELKFEVFILGLEGDIKLGEVVLNNGLNHISENFLVHEVVENIDLVGWNRNAIFGEGQVFEDFEVLYNSETLQFVDFAAINFMFHISPI